MDQMIHTGTLCIVTGCTDNLPVNVISLDICLNISSYQLFCFLKAVIPQLHRNQIVPCLSQKCP